MQKIVPILVTGLVSAAFTGVIILITMYFTLGTLANRVAALEDNSVRKDLLSAELDPIHTDLLDIKMNIVRKSDFDVLLKIIQK